MKKLLVVVVIVSMLLNVAFYAYHYGNSATSDSHHNHQVVPPVNTPEIQEPEPEPSPPEPTVPVFIEVKKFRNVSRDSVYADVLSHSNKGSFGNAHGRSTNVHETAHRIHSYIRNSYRQGKINGFYCLNGRGVIIEEPNMRKSRIAEFLPQNLRSYRYGTYISGQAWDSIPLYIYDEWTAYVLGGMCNVDDVQSGRYRGAWTDGVSGCLGFSIYAVATCMAVKKYDPNYWETNEQFRNFTIYMLHQAHETYMVGSKMDKFKWDKQDRLLKELLTSREAEPMRAFMNEYLEGVWLEDDVQVSIGEYELYQRVDLQANDDPHRRITS